jgi:acyl carrier protein
MEEVNILLRSKELPQSNLYHEDISSMIEKPRAHSYNQEKISETRILNLNGNQNNNARHTWSHSSANGQRKLRETQEDEKFRVGIKIHDYLANVFYESKFTRCNALPQKLIHSTSKPQSNASRMQRRKDQKTKEILITLSIRSAIVKILPVASDYLDTPFLQLGADSLSLAEISSEIQSCTGICLSVIDLLELKTPNEIINYILYAKTAN